MNRTFFIFLQPRENGPKAGHDAVFVSLMVVVLIGLLITPGSLHSQMAGVDQITFSGNEQISDGALRKAIKTSATPWYHSILFWKDPSPFIEEVFLTDLLRIEQYYYQEGYHSARIVDYALDFNEANDEVDISIDIEEGAPLIVDSVRFDHIETDSVAIEERRLLRLVTLKHGKRYREENLRIDYNRITRKYGNSGYPYAIVRMKPDIDLENNTVDLVWIVNPGPFCRFGEIEIAGNTSVSDRLIRRGIDFKTGQTFKQKKLATAQSQIYQLELFQYVNLQTARLEERPRDIPVQVRVKERDLRTLSIGAGYGTEESYRVKADWTNRNFFGGARILRTKAKHSTRLLPLSIEMEMSQPFFLDDQNDILFRTFFIWQDEASFEARRLGFETVFNRQLSSYNNLFIKTRTERDSVIAKGEVSSEILNDLYNKSILTVGINHNSTNQVFTPTSGHIAKLVLEEAGLLFNSRFEYYKMWSEYRFYDEIFDDNILALRLYAGGMKPHGGSSVTPVEERFFAGGSYSVRGWGRQQLGPSRIDEETGKRRPLGGNSRVECNLELRYPLMGRFGGTLFLDIGDVWQRWNGFRFSTLNYSAGAGLNYNTPIGPVRLDVAWKINKQHANEDGYQFHISIGQAF